MIFVSYSWRDREFASRLVARMRQLDVPYWIDDEQLDLSQSLEGQILRGLAQSNVLLLLASSTSWSSPWVQFEVSSALRLARPVHCVKVARVLGHSHLVAPELRSPVAQAKAATDTTGTGERAPSFTNLPRHLGPLAPNSLHTRGRDDTIGFDPVATPTPMQRRAFELIGQPIPIRHR